MVGDPECAALYIGLVFGIGADAGNREQCGKLRKISRTVLVNKFEDFLHGLPEVTGSTRGTRLDKYMKKGGELQGFL